MRNWTRDKAIAVIIGLLVLAGCTSANLITMKHMTSPTTITRVVHVKSPPVVKIVTKTIVKTKTTRVVLGPSTPCFDAGPGAVYLPQAAGAVTLPETTCSISFFAAVPASGGTYLRLTAPSGDSESFLLGR